MNFRASSTYTPVDISRVMQRIVPQMIAAVTEGCDAVATEAEAIVPVDTGLLKSSIVIGKVELDGNTVRGSVEANTPYAGYVEFGTGKRGASSPGAGPYPYTDSWPGMPSQPYMRPALDTARPAIIDAFAKRGFKVS